VVDKLNWEGGHAYDDAFRVRKDGVRLSVTRIDAKAAEGGGGWGMPLRFRCCVPPHSPAAVAAAAAAEEERRIALGRAEAAVADAVADARGHYWRLGVPIDFSAQELKRAYRQLSLRLHPDRAGGSTEAMAAVAAAHDCLADAACRRAFDEGAQLEQRRGKGPLAQAVERHYRPERFPHEPFGDPFAHARGGEERRQRADARRREQAASGVAASPMPEAEEAEVAKEEL